MKLTDFGVKREVATLSNGVRLIVFERPGMPIALRASFRSGGRYDVAGKEGLAHFAEHMVVAGTERFPSKDKLATYIEQYGGIFGATTSSELLNINIGMGDPLDFDKAVEVLSEMLTKSNLDEKTFTMEKGSVLRELIRKQSNPAAWLWEIWRELFFQDTAVGRSVIGSKATIDDMQLSDIKAYFKQYINAERLTIIVSGGLNISEVKLRLEKGLQLTSSTRETTTGQTVPNLRARNLAIQKFMINDQIDLAFGFRSCSLGSPDNAALDLVAAIMGGGRASTLSRILRYERGLVYSIGAFNMEHSDHGSWNISTQCAKKDLGVVLSEIGKELKRVVDGGLSASELEFAQNKMIKSKRMQMQTSESWVSRHTESEVFLPEGNWTIANYMQDLEEARLEDLQRVAKKYFKPGTWYLALCGDIEENEMVVDY